LPGSTARGARDGCARSTEGGGPAGIRSRETAVPAGMRTGADVLCVRSRGGALGARSGDTVFCVRSGEAALMARLGAACDRSGDDAGAACRARVSALEPFTAGTV